MHIYGRLRGNAAKRIDGRELISRADRGRHRQVCDARPVHAIDRHGPGVLDVPGKGGGSAGRDLVGLGAKDTITGGRKMSVKALA